MIGGFFLPKDGLISISLSNSVEVGKHPVLNLMGGNSFYFDAPDNGNRELRRNGSRSPRPL